MKVKVAIVSAFVDAEKGGNPAGVVLEADALNYEQKLNIAKQVGLSETAFVSTSTMADFKLDFFTPQKQIAHCGHATIATFSYLSQLGLMPNQQSSKETIDGVRKVSVQHALAYMEQLAPSYTKVAEDKPLILRALGIKNEDLLAEPIIANTGNGFLLIGLKNPEQLLAITPKQSLINDLSERYDLIGFYVFTLRSNIPGRDASTRMFAPRYGIQEESATGMAAGPLAGYLYDYINMKKADFAIEQGYAMTPPSPSCIQVQLNLANARITSLTAGGVGVVSSNVEIEI